MTAHTSVSLAAPFPYFGGKRLAALIAALTIATIAGLCALALHPALYPSDATDTGDLT